MEKKSLCTETWMAEIPGAVGSVEHPGGIKPHPVPCTSPGCFCLLMHLVGLKNYPLFIY